MHSLLKLSYVWFNQQNHKKLRVSDLWPLYTGFIQMIKHSVEYDAFLPQVGVDRVHLLHVEPLFVCSDACIGILLQLELHFSYR